MNNLEIAQQAISLARAAGANDAEAFLQRARVLTIEVQQGNVETVKQSEDIGIAMRAQVGNAMGLSYATSFDDASLKRAAERAVEIARASDSDPFVGFAEPMPARNVDAFDAEIHTHSADEKVERALAIERAARAYDARIVMSRRCAYIERESNLAIANTRGIVAEQKSSGCGGMAMVIARENGAQEAGFGSDFQRRYSRFDPKKVGEEAGERAVSLLGATNGTTTRGAILLEPRVTADFMQIIANLLRADNVQKNKSLLAGKLGQAVAAAGVTLIDDGAHPDAPGVRAWDDEGVPSQKTMLIADGVLQSYLHSTYTARKGNAKSTSSANRFSFKMPPDPTASNLELLPGKASREDLLAGITGGLWVRQLMNLHTVNAISGEYSFGASGMWIENGKILGPVRGVTIAGNLVDLLKNVRGIASDTEWGRSVGAPSVLIEDVSIAGK